MWSTSGFLWAYLGAAVFVVVGALVHRQRLFSGPRTGAEDIDPQQAAYLNNGERTAVYASLAGLRCADAVGLTPEGRLTVTGPLPIPATTLDRAVYVAAAVGQPQRALRTDPAVQEAVADLKSGLERAGMLLEPGKRRRARLGAWLLLALLVVGVARFAIGLGEGAPVGYLGLAILAVLGAHRFLISRIPRLTATGEAALAELYHAHVHLEPTQQPAFRTYGPTAAAMAVALFGTAALWTLDGAMAHEAEIEHAGLYTGPTGTVGADNSLGCSSVGGCGSGGCGGGGGGG